MKTLLLCCIVIMVTTDMRSQVLVDSIPLPQYGQSTNFYGLDGDGTILYLGKDSDGQIIAFDTSTQLEVATYDSPYDFCHGLAKTAAGFYILEDYSSAGALMFEIDEAGNEVAIHELPDGILGPPQGVGGLDLVGDAVWFTVYYQDSDIYPYAYAYLWDPSQSTFIDTVPMEGGQPHGIEQIGNLLVYVMDDNDDDLEKLYGYDLVNEVLIFDIDLPDTQIDNDMSPRGLHFDGSYLWLIAKRTGGSAFAYQTLYKYDLGPLSIGENSAEPSMLISPNPSSERINIAVKTELVGSRFFVYNILGEAVQTGKLTSENTLISIGDLPKGTYEILMVTQDARFESRFVKE